MPAVGPEAAGEHRQLVVAGERHAPIDRRPEARWVPGLPLGERLDVDAVGQHEVAKVVTEARRAVEDVGAGVVERRGPEVDVGRVQLVRLDRERLECRRGIEPLGAKPVGLVALVSKRIGEGTIGEAEWKVGGGASPRARRWNGCCH